MNKNGVKYTDESCIMIQCDVIFTMRNILLIFGLSTILCAQTNNSEFRATWIITWDWISPEKSAVEIQDHIREILDNHVDAHMTSVLFQIRQSGTAYYHSSFEPWGYYAGYSDPGFDPLEFAVKEAHKRGLELHAWFNTFQVSSTYAGTPAEEHPEWVCRDQDGYPMESYRSISPGLEAVRDYLLGVAMEVVNNYNIDGLHLDYVRWNEYTNTMNQMNFREQPEEIHMMDGWITEAQIQEINQNQSGRYLYDIDHPYSGGIPAGFSSWEEWWRSSVTEFVSALHDSIQIVKPYVRLSVAALGKYNWGGWQGYGTVYQDAALWYNEGFIDQLTPMHYHWETGTGFLGMLINDCPNCWSDYIQDGIADHRIFSVGPPSYSMPWKNHKNIVNDCRTVDWVDGFQFFSSGSWDYFGKWADAGNTFFAKKTKIPESFSTESIQPNTPALNINKIDSLHYQLNVTPSDTSHLNWFVLYRSETDSTNPEENEMIEIRFADSAFSFLDSFDGTQDFNGQYHYYATQANRFWKESLPSNIFVSDSIPSFAPVIVSIYPEDLDSVDVTTSPVINFSKTMTIQDSYNFITITPDPGHNLVWTNSNKSVTINVWYNLEYDTTYSIVVSSDLADVNNVALDGNGDGIAGDDYSFQFRTFAQDVLGPMITETSFSVDNPVDIGQLLTVTFNEEINSTSLNTNSVLLTANNNTISYNNAYSVFNEEFSSYTIRPIEGHFSANTEYQIQFTDGITDLDGNPMQPITFTFNSEPQVYDEVAFIDEFDNTANWWTPSGSGSTVGILSGTSFEIDNTISIPGTYPRKSAKLSYVWDTSVSDHLIRTYLSGGDPRAVEFDTSYTLECYVYGDGSHNYFRFALDDHLPTTAGNYHEVSRWFEIDWIGWKLITWDLGVDSVGSWIGNGKLEGTLRTDSFQMTYNDAFGISEGAIYFDDYKITKKSFSLNTRNEHAIIPEKMTLFQNYPNPFNPITEIQYSIPQYGYVSIMVYNLLGQQVKTLVNEIQNAGSHTIIWDGNDSYGQTVASGIYFCQLKSVNEVKTIRMVFTK